MSRQKFKYPQHLKENHHSNNKIFIVHTVAIIKLQKLLRSRDRELVYHILTLLVLRGSL